MFSLMELLNIIESRQVLIIEGIMGSGKTLLMTALTRIYCERYDIKYVLSNAPIYFPDLNGVEYSALTGTDQLDKVAPESITNIDELLQIVNSRDALSASNKYITTAAVSLRKVHSKWFGTVQFASMIDIRFDFLAQLIISPKFYKKYHNNVKEDMKIRLQNHDFRLRLNIWDKTENKRYTLILNTYNFINMYDTNYIPYKLAISHVDYLEWVQMSKSKKQRDAIEVFNKKLIDLSLEEWNIGQKILMDRFT